MSNATITSDLLKEKKTGYTDNINDILYSNETVATSVNGETDVTVSNTQQLEGYTLEELRDNIDASTIEGYSATEVLAQNGFNNIRLLIDTHNTSAIPQNYMFAVTDEEEIIFWGRNPSNVYVYGIADDHYGLTTITNPKLGISPVKQIIAAHWEIFVLYEDGDLYAMGMNNIGQLGIGNTATPYKLTLTATSVVKVATASAGYDIDQCSTLILRTDGTVWGCGNNDYGQLGVGTVTNYETSWVQSLIPAGVGTPINIFINDSLYATSYIITDTGKVLATGYNAHGKLGNGSTTNGSAFSKIIMLDEYFVVDLVTIGGTRSGTGRYVRCSTMCLTDTGLVFGWGANINGELGIGTTTTELVPVDVTTTIPAPYDPFTNPIVKLINGKAEFGLFGLLSQNGDLFMAGNNGYGQIGDGTTTTTTTWYHTMSNVKQVEVLLGRQYCYFKTIFAITNDDKLYSWGYNGEGQTCQNHTTNVLVPTLVDFEYSDKIVQISCGGYSSANNIFILIEDGRVFACGNNDYQQISNNSCANIRRLVYTYNIF